ncbi:MAG TPA: triphosphoribosyl-dephospho-CoA synthase [Gemmataceae bacterium]|jgi:triphosphoribosyl-dephospho-CoA synthase|nr:triphosphoribosyl-dephospho-CoA synthase [Gemmataceae bacterium]
MLSIGVCAQLACIWEATARKPGNVHRFRDSEDMSYLDFLQSAAAIAPVLETAHQRRVGETVLQCIEATRAVTNTNTNLGIVLLLAPLATVHRDKDLQPSLKRVLKDLDVVDSRDVYQAIRLARPGGLGRVSDQDVSQEPTLPLREAMAIAADRDMIARQYATCFLEVFNDGVPTLIQALDRKRSISLEEAIIHCQLRLMQKYPDSLIARKSGGREAREASRRSGIALTKFWRSKKVRWQELAKLDAWLRAKGNRRNPGTTADLVTASLFIALRQGSITLPLSRPFSADDDHA